MEGRGRYTPQNRHGRGSYTSQGPPPFQHNGPIQPYGPPQFQNNPPFGAQFAQNDYNTNFAAFQEQPMYFMTDQPPQFVTPYNVHAQPFVPGKYIPPPPNGEQYGNFEQFNNAPYENFEQYPQYDYYQGYPDDGGFYPPNNGYNESYDSQNFPAYNNNDIAVSQSNYPPNTVNNRGGFKHNQPTNDQSSRGFKKYSNNRQSLGQNNQQYTQSNNRQAYSQGNRQSNELNQGFNNGSRSASQSTNSRGYSAMSRSNQPNYQQRERRQRTLWDPNSSTNGARTWQNTKITSYINSENQSNQNPNYTSANRMSQNSTSSASTSENSSKGNANKTQETHPSRKNSGNRNSPDNVTVVRSGYVRITTSDGMNDYVSSTKDVKPAAEVVDDSDLDQRGTLTKQLTAASYECVVCYSTIRCDVAVWNCSSCFHVFHLFCVRKWAKSSVVDQAEGEDSGWRCPTCQHVTKDVPNKYLCYCGKISDPEWNRQDTPHSCGEVCGKPRSNDCPHKCNILCHPGPCPSCEAVTTKTCLCKKNTKSTRCGTGEVYRCTEACGRMMNCGIHRCEKVCHRGVCLICRESVIQDCHGGHESREVLCGSDETTVPTYQCGATCSVVLSCGNHQCGEPCHSGGCGLCQREPSNVTTCPCGKVKVDELKAEPRTSCLDPLATCDSVCGKELKCGPKGSEHICTSMCHDGPCPPCSLTMDVTCSCTGFTDTVPCTEALDYTVENPFKCKKRCKKKRSCGRHKCNQLCCVDQEHLCTLTCGSKLSCGRHKCDQLCHSQPCPSCLMSSFEELRCECGGEIMYPPIPCGTHPPECARPCTRTHRCDHEVLHNCHHEAKCPPCVVLTTKSCMGGHEMITVDG